MNYQETLDYIHCVSWTGSRPGLSRMTELLEKLGNPQDTLRFIHVAGTNGKGSFCSMLESILRAAGYRTGMFTSPYIKSFNERMMVSGQPISNEALADLVTRIQPVADAMTDRPTEFELITAIGFAYFKECGCDVVILEAGMGGRLDSTNVIRNPLLSVITGIALDHTAFLGDTVEKIAAEKAGIIKDGAPVLFGGNDASAAEIIKKTASERGSAYFAVDYDALQHVTSDLSGSRFDFANFTDMHIKLLGLYQPRNAAVVLSAVSLLQACGLTISESALRQGLLEARWPARFEILSQDPLVIFDGAHNPQGIDAAVESIGHYFGKEKVYIMTGVLRDKDYRYIASRLATVAERAFVLTPENPRALDGEEYASILQSFGVSSAAYPSIADAYKSAVDSAKKDGKPLLILGSLYTYEAIASL